MSKGHGNISFYKSTYSIVILKLIARFINNSYRKINLSLQYDVLLENIRIKLGISRKIIKANCILN